MCRKLIAIAVLLLFCAGCSSNTPLQTEASGDSSPEPGATVYDAQNKYTLGYTASFQECGTSYVGNTLMGSYLHYYDMETGISGYLCADPSCTHNTSACGACVRSGTTISYYDGLIYYVSGNGVDIDIWRGDLSGMSRKLLKTLDFDAFISTYSPIDYVVHRGRMYILGQNSQLSYVASECRVTLQSTPLDSSQDFTILFDKTYSCAANPVLRLVGDAAYLQVTSYPASGGREVEIFRIDLDSQEIETILSGQTFQGGNIFVEKMWVTPDERVYLPFAVDGLGYLWEIVDGQAVERIAFGEMATDAVTTYAADGIAFCVCSDGTIQRHVDIRTLDGEAIYSGQLLPDAVPEIGDAWNNGRLTLTLVGGDAEKLIVTTMISSTTPSGFVTSSYSYTLQLSIADEMQATVLWEGEVD